MSKSFVTSLLVWVISFAIVTLTKDGSILLGEFSLIVPDLIYSIATWALGISTTITIPVGIKAWLSNRYNVMMNAGLQDMKLTQIIEQNDLIIRMGLPAVETAFALTETEILKFRTEVQESGEKALSLTHTFANYISVNVEQKIAYIKHQIDTNEVLKSKAEQIGDINAVKKYAKAISAGYTILKKL